MGVESGGGRTPRPVAAAAVRYHRSSLTTQSLPPEFDAGTRYDGGYAPFVGGSEPCASPVVPGHRRCRRPAFVRFNCGHKVWCLRCYNDHMRRRGWRMGRVTCPRPACRARIATAAYADTDPGDFRAR